MQVKCVQGCVSKGAASSLRQESLPLYPGFVRPHLDIMSCIGPPNTRNLQTEAGHGITRASRCQQGPRGWWHLSGSADIFCLSLHDSLHLHAPVENVGHAATVFPSLL